MTTGRLLVTDAGVGSPALGPGEPPGPTGRLPAPAGIPGETIVPEGMPPSTTAPWHELQLSPAIGVPTTWPPLPQGAWQGWPCPQGRMPGAAAGGMAPGGTNPGGR